MGTFKKCRPEATLWLKKYNKEPSMKCVATLSNIKSKLDTLHIPFGIGYGVLLGWYRQCSCIGNSNDLDLVIRYSDVKDRLHILSALGTTMYLDNAKRYPRIVKITSFGLHIDLIVSYYSKEYNVAWDVDGDERSIMKTWNIHEYDVAKLHGVAVRIPKDPLDDIHAHYCDRWDIPDSRWESVPKGANRLEIFGSCHFIDVLSNRIQDYGQPDATVVQESDLLEYYLNAGGQCYLERGNLNRTRCINSNYKGTRGGAFTAFDVVKVKENQAICIGIVAYQGVKTLENTLQSFRTHGLFKDDREVRILFQQLDAPGRRAWAEDVIQRYPELIPIYETKNIQNEAFFKLIKACSKSEFVMIVEEDFGISNTVKDLKSELENAVYMLNHGADAVRMRSRTDGGGPNYSKEGIVKTGEIIKTHMISHVMVDDHAENSHPEISVCRNEPKTWCTSSKYGHYTNNPVLYRISFANEIFKQVPQDMRSFSKFEPWMTKWWSNQDFVLAWSNGIFKHTRLDRTFGLKSVLTQNNNVVPLSSVPLASTLQAWMPGSEIGDRKTQLLRWIEIRDAAYRIALEQLAGIATSMGLEWSLRAGSVIGPARYGAWDYVTEDVVNIVDYDVDTAVFFDSQEVKAQKCPELLRKLSNALQNVHPDGTCHAGPGCHFKWLIDKGLGLDTVRSSDVTYSELVNFGVDPVVKYGRSNAKCQQTDAETFCWCHQDGSYCVADSHVHPLTSYHMPGVNGKQPTLLRLPGNVFKYTKSFEVYNGNTHLNCDAVPFAPVDATTFFRDFNGFEKKHAHRGTSDPSSHSCTYLEHLYQHAMAAHEKNEPNFWDAWQSNECKSVRARVEGGCGSKNGAESSPRS